MSMENKEVEEKSEALDELLDLYADKLQRIREDEREVEKIRLKIQRLRPSFDFMDIFNKPISEQLSPISNNEEKPYRSEVEEDPISQAKRQEEFNN